VRSPEETGTNQDQTSTDRRQAAVTHAPRSPACEFVNALRVRRGWGVSTKRNDCAAALDFLCESANTLRRFKLPPTLTATTAIRQQDSWTHSTARSSWSPLVQPQDQTARRSMRTEIEKSGFGEVPMLWPTPSQRRTSRHRSPGNCGRTLAASARPPLHRLHPRNVASRFGT
jgi:hypothetical protein